MLSVKRVTSQKDMGKCINIESEVFGIDCDDTFSSQINCDSKIRGFVCRYDGHIAGVMCIRYQTGIYGFEPDGMLLAVLATDKKYRGLGVGRKLLNHLSRISKGMQKIWLKVDTAWKPEDKKKLLKLYDEYGFIKMERSGDILVMCKFL